MNIKIVLRVDNLQVFNIIHVLSLYRPKQNHVSPTKRERCRAPQFFSVIAGLVRYFILVDTEITKSNTHFEKEMFLQLENQYKTITNTNGQVISSC